ncbi:MAG: PH domain-containing protein [Dermatophilaceae bacterium]
MSEPDSQGVTGTTGDLGPEPPRGSGAQVTLHGGDLPWRTVSSKLATVRLLGLAAGSLVPIVAAAVVAVLLTRWAWLAVAAFVVIALVEAWVVTRQVSAISFVELDEELVIRKGRLLRTLVSVPYARLQYVDVQSGPLMRAFGLASLQLHTASPASGGSMSGLPIAEAEALRARLMERGESQRADL